MSHLRYGIPLPSLNIGGSGGAGQQQQQQQQLHHHVVTSSIPTTTTIPRPQQDDEDETQCTEADWDALPLMIEDKRTNSIYRRGKLLGKGGFARCFLFKNSKDQEVAGKVVLKKTLAKERTKRKLITEIKIHADLRHKHVVQFQHYFEDTSSVYMIMELCENKSMMELMKKRRKLTEPEVQYYTKQLLDGVSYLHQKLVIHRDLKLGNLFLTSDLLIKIGDFGLATRLERRDERKVTICGTPNYLAPEILDGAKAGGHSFEVDIWSIGVIVFTLLVGKPPFETSSVKTTYKKIRATSYEFPLSAKISEQAKSLIRKILTREPKSRPSLAEISNHEFFSIPSAPPVALPISSLNVAPLISELTFAAKSNASNYVNVEMTPSSSESHNSSSSPWKVLANGGSNKYSEHPEKENSPMRNMENISSANRVAQKEQNIQSDFAELQSLCAHISAQIPANFVISSDSSKSSRTNKPAVSSIPSPLIGRGPSVSVTRWVDYTSKYGLGYLLSNGSVGVYFNDATKIILNVNGIDLEYYDKSHSLFTPPQSLNQYDSSLEKKIVLLKHFRDYLFQQERGAAPLQQPVTTYPHSNRIPQSSGPFVKKWLKTKHAVFFRLSDGTVQVKFHDRSEMMITSVARIVAFIDRRGIKELMTLDTVNVHDRPDIGKRLKYLKDILQLLVELKGEEPTNTQTLPSSGGDAFSNMPSSNTKIPV